MELSDIQTILKQFPWATGRIGKDGGFNIDLILAIRYLLGSGPNFGFGAAEEPDTSITMQKVFTAGGLPAYNHWGRILLSDKHFDEQSGWKIPADETPWLTFSQGRKFPPAFEHNWTSYYKWRRLPLKSLAALLLHWPLSIYRLLYLLGFGPSEDS
jgi:hypothetical protein